MPRHGKLLVAIAALSLAVATLAAAAGSHALAGVLDEPALRNFETAVRLQFYHGLGLLALPLLAERLGSARLFTAAGWLLVAGTLLFCGTLYSDALGGPAMAGGLAPLGGLCFVAGWVVAAGAALLGREQAP